MTKQQNLFTVKAFVLTTRELTLYSPEGESVNITQGDPRVARIVNEVQPFVAANQTKVVSLDHVEEVDPIIPDNHYGKAEEKSGGLVRFFRIAKSKLKKFLGGETTEEINTAPAILEPMTCGTIPSDPTEEMAEDTNAIDQIMANAIPATSNSFSVPTAAEADTDTVVAVMGKTVISGVEALAPQVVHAVASNNAGGLMKFMERVAAVAAKRGHSVDDLMKFMKLGDLPVTDNGDIVVYKALTNKNFGGQYGNRFKWADIHSKNVPQRLGSLVHMDESLVDPDRRQDCSNGLHIASRSYLSSFKGDVCVIALVRPEDVIAVPEYNNNKMRVCAYHIIEQLSADQYRKLLSDQPITDTEEGQLLLGRIMSGKHIGVTNKVKIGGGFGSNITVTEVSKEEPIAPKAPEVLETHPADAPIPQEATQKASKAPKRKVKALVATSAKKTPKAPVKAPVVQPKAVSNQGLALKAGGQVAQAAELYKAVVDAKWPKEEKVAAQALLDFKKKAKKSWSVLGLADTTGEDLNVIVGK